MVRRFGKGLVLTMALIAAAAEFSACHWAAPRSAPTRRCPLAALQGACSQMTRDQKDRVRIALQTHVLAELSECARVRDALLAWLNELGQSWVFDTHAADDSVTGLLVLGVTAFHADPVRPAGFALRRGLFLSDPRLLARATLHEAAHLVGKDEDGAQALDALCFSRHP